MRKLISLVAAATLAVAASSPAFATGKAQMLSLIDVSGASTALPPGSFDPNADGPVPLGGRMAFTDTLYRWAGTHRGARAGHLDGLCTAVKLDYNAHSERLRCEGSVFLTGGRILVAGEVTFSEHSNSFQLVVLGGTARYAGVRGFVQANDLPSGNMNFAFHLMS